jgi:hypothetical protein
MANTKNKVEKLTLPMGRLQYVHLDQPTSPPDTDQTPSYQITLIYGAGDDLSAVKSLIDQMAIAEFGEQKYTQLVKKGKFKNPLKSNSGKTYFNEEGEEVQARGFEDTEGYHISLKTRNKDWMKIFDAHRNIISEDAVIAGHYARANGGFMAYDVGGSQGVTCYLNAIQVCKAGEPLGQVTSNAEDDFEEYTGEGAVLASDIDANAPF